MQSDDVLLRRILAGDGRSFEILLDRYEDALRRHVSRMIRDEAAAEDLAQDVFLRVWTKAEQFEGFGSV